MLTALKAARANQLQAVCLAMPPRQYPTYPIVCDGYTAKGPWQTHPKRFSRHKAMIQCARMAFGFGGIYDQDEAERIAESAPPIKHIDPATLDAVTRPSLC